MKLIARLIKSQPIKKHQALACELYDTGIFEAMYLAGMVADGAQLTAKQLHAWAEAAAHRPMISEYPIQWLAAEHPEASPSNGSFPKRST